MNRKYRNLTFILILFWVAVSLMTSLYGLRYNNQRMEELRAAVVAADRNGDDEKIEEALFALRDHILYHMNTELQPRNVENSEKPIQLSYKYYRDTLKKWNQEIDEVGVGGTVIREARSICETDDFVISERLNCLISETQRISQKQGVQGFPAPKTLLKDFYVYDFPSPRWSPDLAGISLVSFGLSLVVLVVRLLF